MAQVPEDYTPHFKEFFDALRASCETYYSYSDSLADAKDKDQWIGVAKRRSQKMRELYVRNEEMGKRLLDICLHHKKEIPMKAYADLYESTLGYTTSRDNIYYPTSLLQVCKVLEFGGPEVIEELKCANVLNLWRLFCYLQMWNLGNNDEYLKKAYECGKFVMSDEAKKYPYYEYALSRVLRYMTKSMWLVTHMQTVKEYREYCGKLREFLARPDIDDLISANLKHELMEIERTEDEALVRNVYLAGDTLLSKEEGDSLTHLVVERNLANPSVSDLSYVRTLYMQMQLGQLTPNQALDKCLQRYASTYLKIKDKALSNRELNGFLQPFFTSFYINYKASIPFVEKRKNVINMCKSIENCFLHFKDKHENTEYVRDLLKLATYDKVTMYLTPEEVGRFLNTLNLAVSPTIYGRTFVSTKAAEEIAKELVKYKPELLVGILGCKTVDEVMKKGKDIVNFVRQASMYHNIGMNSVAMVAKKDFRLLYQDEKDIYERHTLYGLEYFKMTPMLTQFNDVSMGHHKWYNGKGGYPEDYDNTKSPIRIVVDIVSFSNALLRTTMQAVHANHTRDEVVKIVLDEMKSGAGTKYHPELVNILFTRKGVAKKIGDFADGGWLTVFYEIYRKYISNKEVDEI